MLFSDILKEEVLFFVAVSCLLGVGTFLKGFGSELPSIQL